MDIQAQAEKYGKFVKYGVVILAAAALAPIIFLAIQGLAGLMLAVGMAIVGWNVAPVLSKMAYNAKMRALEAEDVSNIAKVSDAAAVNPIETLMNQAMEKRQASDQFRTAITGFRTEVKNFSDQIAQFAKEYPDDVARFQMQKDAMDKLLKFREDRYKQLQRELDNFDAAIKRAQAMWKMSQAAQKMNKLAGVELADPFEKIKADSAINSVMTSMNKAFAEMETALLDNKEVQQAVLAVENNPQPVLTVGTSVQQKVSV